MRRLTPLVFSALFIVLNLTAASCRAANDGNAAVEALGGLNGIALACDQPALVARARHILVSAAPKTRAIGELFENATQRAYLAQGKGGQCPDAASLARQIADAEQGLSTAFPPGK